MPRFTCIGMQNHSTSEQIPAAVITARSAGLEIYQRAWSDMYSNARGSAFAVRTRHLKRLPRFLRNAIRNP